MSKAVYLIANPKAFFMFGSYILGWYSGDNDNGASAEFSQHFSLYCGVKTYTTKKEAEAVLKGLLSIYPDCYIVKSDEV